MPLRGIVPDQTGWQQAMCVPKDSNTPITAATHGVLVHALRCGKGADLYIRQRMRMIGEHTDPRYTKALFKYFCPPEIRRKREQLRHIRHAGDNPHRPDINPQRGGCTVHAHPQNSLKLLCIRSTQSLLCCWGKREI